MSGCSLIGGSLGTGGTTGTASPPAASAPAPTADAGETSRIDEYLDMMRALIEGDARTQSDTFSRAARGMELAPTTTNQLSFALALSIPGHAGSDAALAEQHLSALLAADRLPAPERVLAIVQLRDVERRLALEIEALELRAEIGETAAARDAAAAARIQTLLDENRRLRAALDDATSRLDAITTIEQSIRELEDDAD